MKEERPKRQRRRGVRQPLNQDPAKLRTKRLEAGLQQKDLARLADCSRSHVSEIEKGYRSASPQLLHKFADALDCPVGELINTAAGQAVK